MYINLRCLYLYERYSHLKVVYRQFFLDQVDKMTLKEFYRKSENKNITYKLTKTKKDLCLSDSKHLREQNLNQLDLKRSAYRQLLNENIPHANIDISNLCTYKFNNEFYSWRRCKTISRQWNLICS